MIHRLLPIDNYKVKEKENKRVQLLFGPQYIAKLWILPITFIFRFLGP